MLFDLFLVFQQLVISSHEQNVCKESVFKFPRYKKVDEKFPQIQIILKYTSSQKSIIAI